MWYNFPHSVQLSIRYFAKSTSKRSAHLTRIAFCDIGWELNLNIFLDLLVPALYNPDRMNAKRSQRDLLRSAIMIVISLDDTKYRVCIKLAVITYKTRFA